MTPRTTSRAPLRAPTADVTAVLVSHDGARWLPAVLAALQAQTVRPRQVVAVDTGSDDGSLDLLRTALGDDAVIPLPRRTGYPAAVAAGLQHAAPGDAHVWLLHDDAAPDPDCLERLLEEAERAPSAALLGPKAVDWDDPRLLVEVGLTTDRGGSRTTGLERREQDQGQHDAVRDVLAVGTAGALVRREAWDGVGGLDPLLPLFRDELDLGWRLRRTGARVLVVPSARVRHARAATTGRRSPGPLRAPAVRVDRRHALLVLLAHASRRRLAVALPALVVAALLRALGLVLLRRAGAARDELAAVGWVLRSPGRLRRARAARRALGDVAVGPLLVSRAGRVRERLQAVTGWLAAGGPPAGPDTDDVDDGGAPSGSLVRALLSRPAVAVLLLLVLVTLLAERGLLPLGGGLLSGGRLLPPPPGAEDLWAVWTASWSPAGEGTSAPASPQVAVLALLSTVLLGKPWLAVDVLLLAAVPLSGLTAYLAAGRLVASRALRAWAAATWALLPVATGAVAAGRLDVAAVQVVLPLLGTAVAVVLCGDPRGSWHRVWAVALLLTLTTALAPTLWLVAAPALVATAVGVLVGAPRAQRPGARRRALAALVVPAVPVALLLPWSREVVSAPGLLLHGPGRLAADPALADADLPAPALVLLSPGGAGLPPTWVTAGLLLAALAGLVRGAGRRPVVAAWATALLALAVAAVLARTAVQPPAGGPALPVWPGVPLQLAAAGLLVAALVAGDGARARLSRHDFGWRQVLAVALAGLAIAGPVAAAATWVVRGAGDPLDRRTARVVPAFVDAELRAEPGVRALVLDPRPDGSVGYELRSGAGVRLGLTDLPRAVGAERLDAVVADLVTPRGGPAAAALATRAVRYVALPRSAADSDVAAALDDAPGLTRRSEDPVLLWQVLAPAARLTVLPPEAAGVASAEPGPDPRGPQPQPVDDAVPSGPAGRLLVLAASRDDGWTATLDGEPLEPTTAWGWAQAWQLPAGGGALEVEHDAGERQAAVAVQAAAVVLVAVLAVPPARRRSGLEPVEPERSP